MKRYAIDPEMISLGEFRELLKRETGSYRARPFPLSYFPGIPFEYVELLKTRGIRNTREFFERVQSEQQQSELASGTGIPVYRLKELFSLCDLSRITGVGGINARVLYETGIRSTAEFAGSDPSLLRGKCRDITYAINYAGVIVECDHKTDLE